MSARVVAIDDLATWTQSYVRPRQLAECTGIPLRTIYHHIEQGALPSRKIGGLCLIRLRDARVYADTPPAS